MKADVSRSTFDPQNHYSTVLMQQGRVQIDADWNEQQAINRHRAETFAGNVIGVSGMPIDGASGVAAGFEITPVESTLQIGKGHGYVGGLLCLNGENSDDETTIPFEKQPFWQGALDLELDGEQLGLVYLEAWERHVTAVDEPALLEPALDGVDTTTRAQTVWQVKAAPITGDVDQTWNTIVRPWSAAGNAGTMRIEVPDSVVHSGSGLVAPGAGYSGLENSLFRVEIYQGGMVPAELEQPDVRYVWARDNASILTSVEFIETTSLNGQTNLIELTLASLGRDEFPAYVPGDIVAVHTPSGERNAAWNTPPGQLYEVKAVKPEKQAIVVATIDGAPSTLSYLTKLIGKDIPILARRWDSTQIVQANTTLALKDNIHVVFSRGRYRTGDAWQIPVRASQIGLHGDDQGDILWPREARQDDSLQSPLPPYRALPSQTPPHHFCQLALIKKVGAKFAVVKDLRPLFPQLTGLVRLTPVSGQGQVAQIGIGGSVPSLSAFEVQVVNWNAPIESALVEFKIVGAEGDVGALTSTNPIVTDDGVRLVVRTGSQGIANCTWKPVTPEALANFVQVTVVSADGEAAPITPDTANRTHPRPIRFSVSSVASGVVEDLNVFTIRRVGLIVPDRSGHKFDRPLFNDGHVTVDELIQGIAIECTKNVDPASFMYVAGPDQATTGGSPSDADQLVIDFTPDWRGNKPVVSVSTDQPINQEIAAGGSAPPIRRTVGSTTITLASRISRANGSVLVWEPADSSVVPNPRQATRTLLEEALARRRAGRLPGDGPTRLLMQMIVKGQSIWSREGSSLAYQYLDGEAFGTRYAPTGATEIETHTEPGGDPSQLRTGDHRRGGDFAMWFWLVRQAGLGLIPNWSSEGLDGLSAERRFRLAHMLDIGLDRTELSGLPGEYELAPVEHNETVAQQIAIDLAITPPGSESVGLATMDALEDFSSVVISQLSNIGLRLTLETTLGGDDAEFAHSIVATAGEDEFVLGTQGVADRLRALDGTSYDGTFVRI